MIYATTRLLVAERKRDVDDELPGQVCGVK